MLPPGESFYIRVRGRTSGPFTRAQLRRMYEQGQLSAFHEVSDDGQRWALAGDLGFGVGPPALPGGAAAPPMPAAPGMGPAVGGMGMPPSGSQPQRWFVLDDDDQQHGPMTREQLAQLAQQGAIPASHLIWCEGWPNWIPLGETDLAPAPVYYSAPAPAQSPGYLLTPSPVPARAAPAAPMPQAPRPRPAPAVEPRPTRRAEPVAEGFRFPLGWTLGIVIGLFLILMGFACLGLAVVDEMQSREKESRARKARIIRDVGAGQHGQMEDVTSAGRESRALMWTFAVVGILFVALGLAVVLVSLHKRRQPR